MSAPRRTRDPAHPLSLLAELGRVLGARWPALLAWFLAGWIARLLLIRLAGWLGNIEAVYGLLVLPLAVLARLASYVGMFAVLRDALPRLRRLDLAEEPGARRFARTRRFGESIVGSLFPFLIVYAAWNLIDEDIVAYAVSSLEQFDTDTVVVGRSALTVPVTALSVVLIAGAFAVRFALRRLEARLPRWTGALAAYLEAVWVLLAIFGLRALLAGVPEWLATRRLTAPLVGFVEQLRADSAAVRIIGDGVATALTVLGDVLALPLAWLALAGFVYAAALARSDRARDSRAALAVRARLARLPARSRRMLAPLGEEIAERWDPVQRMAALAWRAGPVLIGTYLLAFAVVQSLHAWLTAAFYHLPGPHTAAWWMSVDELGGLGIDLVLLPVQLALVAVVLDACLGEAEEDVTAAAAEPPAAATTP